jgi:hypothetical protein
MTNAELMEQFQRCEQWRDADQWDALGMLYFQRGFMLNAGVCFQRADACQQHIYVAVETVEQAEVAAI